MTKSPSHSQPANPSLPAAGIDTVCQVTDIALGLNSLAKQLSGTQRAAAYRLKAVTISALVLLGAVRVNGRREKNTFSLDILAADRRVQIHCVLQDLLPGAQTEILRQAERAPIVAPLAERMNSAQLTILRERFGSGVGGAA
jgi:hypothetical protein